MKSGVYQIINKINNKKYIGVTKDFKARFRHHKSDLKLNKHHSIILQRAWNKYGKENFEFNILVKVPIEYLFIIEQWFLKTQKPEYNVAVNSEYYIHRNKKVLSEAHKNNIRKSWTKEKRIQNGIITRNRKIGTHLELKTKIKIGKANSKFEDYQIIEIRKLLNEKKLKGKEIALLYNTSPQMISNIKNYKTYGRIN